MEIRRYVNGKAVTQGELSSLALTTPALISAVRDAGRRAEREEPPSAHRESGPLTAPTAPTRADG